MDKKIIITVSRKKAKNLTVSRKKAKILIVNRKSHYPIETPKKVAHESIAECVTDVLTTF